MADDERERLLLVHFQEVTGLVDPEQSRQILVNHGWNLELAVQDAITIQEGGQSIFATPTPPRPSRPSRPPQLAGHAAASFASENSFASERQLPASPGWWEWFMGWAFFPVRLVISTINELTQIIYNLFVGHRLPAARDPRGDVLQFIHQIHNDLGGPNLPPFIHSSYGEALEEAKNNLKFLLVYLHSPGHQDTPRFCHEVLSSDEFMELLSSNNCLLFGVSVNSEEGTRVSFILRETTYPFMALIMLRGSRMTVIGRLEGYTSLDDVITKLENLFTANQPELVVLRDERRQRNIDQEIRKEQEEEFMKSLHADQEKTRRRMEEERLASEEAEREREIEMKQREQEEEFQLERSMRMSRLPPESPPGDPNAIHINIKLPDGSRLERRFDKSDKLQVTIIMVV
jgi:FAS-associated factor 2